MIDPSGRSGEPPTLPQEIQPPTPSPGIVLPPLPLPSEQEKHRTDRLARVFIREIRVTGSTVFSNEQLGRVTSAYVNRELSAEDLEALRVALTLLYVNNGYVNSGAILPDQTVMDGVVRFQIIEGSLTDIGVKGNRWFRDSYLQKRFALGVGTPLNVNALQQRLQLLLEDQRIRRINAELKPGLKLGESRLDVSVEEQIPYKLWLEYNNHQSPSVGEHRGITAVEHQNLTGNGDIATARYGRSEGLNPLLDFRYALPLNRYDTTLVLQYRRNTFDVIEEPFTDLDIESESDIYSIALRQPIYRTLNHDIAFELTAEHLTHKTSLLGEPFALSPGANRKGESFVTAVRPAVEWVHHSQNQVIAARSRFSFGLDALGATINNNGGPDGRFFAWLGQFQWVRRLPILDTQVIFRSDLQLADSALLTLEQIAVGGRYSVRGYRENTLVRDNAFLTSVEARVTLVSNTKWADYLQLAPFFDYGRGWSHRGSTPDPSHIYSAGVGLRWAMTLLRPFQMRPQFEVYWGQRLRKVERTNNGFQDNGLHLQFVLALF